MKKFVFCALYGALALGALTFVSCEGNDGDGQKDDDTVYNEFTVAGESYTTTGGAMAYYGENGRFGAIELFIEAGDDAGISFNIAIPAQDKTLVAGEYNFTEAEDDEDVVPFNFAGSVGDDVQDFDAEITSGTLNVSVSGTGPAAVYTIEVDCTIEGGETAKGTYRGALGYMDETFESEGSGAIEVNGQPYQADRGEMEFYGDYYNDRTSNVLLYLYTEEGASINIDMLVPAANDRLVAHTYNYSAVDQDAVTEYTFGDWDGFCHVSDGENSADITGGSIEVSVSGTGYYPTYTIAFDCTLEGGGTLEGTYTGTLDWDWSM